MKTLLALTALSIATIGGAANAMAPSSSAELTIERYVPGADVKALSEAEVAAVLNVINSTDSQSDARSQAAALIRAFQ
ncbi:hypothetical protein [Litorisediminicola beolgyonensis]|uniref:Uncharacterized protein n=1 Tax=Litorisediminicola beolgyonensis TaxID=1173614 RepID=A0ABW3ZMP1_9RHOB